MPARRPLVQRRFRVLAPRSGIAPVAPPPETTCGWNWLLACCNTGTFALILSIGRRRDPTGREPSAALSCVCRPWNGGCGANIGRIACVRADMYRRTCDKARPAGLLAQSVLGPRHARAQHAGLSRAKASLSVLQSSAKNFSRPSPPIKTSHLPPQRSFPIGASLVLANHFRRGVRNVARTLVGPVPAASAAPGASESGAQAWRGCAQLVA